MECTVEEICLIDIGTYTINEPCTDVPNMLFELEINGRKEGFYPDKLKVT
jgi:hypothetical protein